MEINIMNTAIQMNMPLGRLNVEPQIKNIREKLQKIEELEAQNTLSPFERPDDTFMVMNLKNRKERLLKELEKLQEIARHDQAAVVGS